MSAEFIGVLEGAITLRISGVLTRAEMSAAQRTVGELLDRQGKSRFLIIVQEFQGTAKSGDWGDVSFQAKYDKWIEKIAIVGDQKWEELAMMFVGKGVRPIPIEYFTAAELPKARLWLSGPS